MAEINIPIELNLTADAQVFGEQFDVSGFDFVLTNYDMNGIITDGLVLSAAALRDYIRYKNNYIDNTSDEVAFDLDPSGAESLRTAINSIVTDDNLAIDSATTPGSYGSALTNAVTAPPNDSPLYMHYIQYLASLLFGHPQALAPISNEDEIKDAMSEQDLGSQFVDVSGLASLDDNNKYHIIQSIYEQLIAFAEKEDASSNRFGTDDASGGWVPMPFKEGDQITFIVQMQGTVAVESSTSVDGSSTVSASTVFGTVTDSNGTLISIDGSNLTVEPKKWLIKLKLVA